MVLLKRLAPPKAQISIVLEKYSLEAGLPFKGNATLSGQENLQIEEVRIEASVENESYNSLENLYRQDVPLSQSFDLNSGDSKTFPFEVNFPWYSRDGGLVIYRLKAVASIRGRPDVTREVTPSVLPPRSLPSTPAVKLQCMCCGTMLELTPGENKQCSNCGDTIYFD